MNACPIIGAGGYAQVVADILLRMSEAGATLTPVGYLDDNPVLVGQTLLGLPALGNMASLSRTIHDAFIIAISDNEVRRRIFQSLQIRWRTICHRSPPQCRAPNVMVGPGSMICAGVVVNPGSTIWANIILNTGCTVDQHNHIRDHVHIAPGVHLGGVVRIVEGTLVGIGATIMPQRRVGSWSVVGAGALLHDNLPDRVVAVGKPTRIISRLA